MHVSTILEVSYQVGKLKVLRTADFMPYKYAAI
jgi:hypothetical protein